MSYRIEYLLFIEILCLFFLPFVTENSCDSLFFDMFHFLNFIYIIYIIYYILISYIVYKGVTVPHFLIVTTVTVTRLGCILGRSLLLYKASHHQQFSVIRGRIGVILPKNEKIAQIPGSQFVPIQLEQIPTMLFFHPYIGAPRRAQLIYFWLIEIKSVFCNDSMLWKIA